MSLDAATARMSYADGRHGIRTMSAALAAGERRRLGVGRGVDDAQRGVVVAGAEEDLIEARGLGGDDDGGVGFAGGSPARGARLGVEVHEQSRLAGELGGDRQVRRERRFPGATLLRYQCDYQHARILAHVHAANQACKRAVMQSCKREARQVCKMGTNQSCNRSGEVIGRWRRPGFVSSAGQISCCSTGWSIAKLVAS